MLLEDVPLPTMFLIGRISCTAYLSIATIAWLGNGLIILVTIRSKTLRGNCNILIAVQAMFDIIIQMSHIPFAYFSYMEVLVSYYTCWKVNFLFVSAMDFSTLLMFFIALDRLIAAKHVVFYNQMNPTLYIGGILTTCIGFCVLCKIITYVSLTEQKTVCLIAQVATGWWEQLWFGTCAMINFGVIAVYYSISKTFKDASSPEYKKINRSLNTMILVYIFGWFLTMFGLSCIFVISQNPRVQCTAEMLMGIFANLNLAAPFFIYYTRSTMYRKEFRAMFRLPAEGASSIAPTATLETSQYPMTTEIA